VHSVNKKSVDRAAKKNPKILAVMTNYTLYALLEPDELPNIPGRKYDDGGNIPVTLPEAYSPASEGYQNCGTCKFNISGKCSVWSADIRSNYWCRSWDVLIETADASIFAPDTETQAAEEEEFQDFSGDFDTGGDGGGLSDY
jgi:hypothetical protein